MSTHRTMFVTYRLGTISNFSRFYRLICDFVCAINVDIMSRHIRFVYNESTYGKKFIFSCRFRRFFIISFRIVEGREMIQFNKYIFLSSIFYIYKLRFMNNSRCGRNKKHIHRGGRERKNAENIRRQVQDGWGWGIMEKFLAFIVTVKH